MQTFKIVDHRIRFSEVVGCVLTFGGELYMAFISGESTDKNYTKVFTREEVKKNLNLGFTGDEHFLDLNGDFTEPETPKGCIEMEDIETGRIYHYTSLSDLEGTEFQITFQRSMETNYHGPEFSQTNFYCLEFPALKNGRNIITVFKLPGNLRAVEKTTDNTIELSKCTICTNSVGMESYSLKFTKNGEVYESSIDDFDHGMSEYNEVIQMQTFDGTEGVWTENESLDNQYSNHLIRIRSEVRPLLTSLFEYQTVYVPLKGFSTGSVYKRVFFFKFPTGFTWDKIYAPFGKYTFSSAYTPPLEQTPIKRKRSSEVCPGAPVKKPKTPEE